MFRGTIPGGGDRILRWICQTAALRSYFIDAWTEGSDALMPSAGVVVVSVVLLAVGLRLLGRHEERLLAGTTPVVVMPFGAVALALVGIFIVIVLSAEMWMCLISSGLLAFTFIGWYVQAMHHKLRAQARAADAEPGPG